MTKSDEIDPLSDSARLQQSPMALASLQNAQQLTRLGRHGAALASYQFLVQQFPGASRLWAELGAAAAGNLDYGLADEAWQRALQLAPADVGLHVSLGRQYYRLRSMEQASQCFKRAVEINPSSPDARMNLASWFEQNRQLDQAWECVHAVLAQHPGNGRALYFKAFLLQRQGRNEEAETAVRDLLKSDAVPADVQANASHLLGTLLDARGEYAEALAAMVKSKTARRQLADPTVLEQGYTRMDEKRRELLAQITPEVLRRWREEAAPTPHPLALLGGAPRSGTTLLEQILGAHPEILVFDESEAFMQELSSTPLPEPAWQMTFKTLDGLTDVARHQWIARYFKSLLHETDEEPGARLLLDKHPSTTGLLHIWLRLFPNSKIIIALRDPRDVVISCFFQNIPVNAASVNFLSMDRTVKFYASCMEVWLRLRELGGFDWMETRYEDVVVNLEGEGRKLTGFLGLPWHEQQAKYYETAGRKFVHSPTYNAVTQPVYNRAVGRWENYAAALAPFLAELEKYGRIFGYS